MDFAVTGHITAFLGHATTTKRTHIVSKMGRVFCFLPTSCASCFDHTIRMDTEEELGFSMVKNKIYRQSEVNLITDEIYVNIHTS